METSDNSGVDQEAQRLVDAWCDFKTVPTIQNYLRVREEHPLVDAPFRTLIPSRLEENDHKLLKQVGISFDDFIQAINGNYQVADRVCLCILQHEVQRIELARKGTTHVVGRGLLASESFVNELVAMMLEESLQQEWPRMPPSLIMLTKFRLVGDFPESSRSFLASERKDQVIRGAAVALFYGTEWTMPDASRAMGIPYGTLKRWFDGTPQFNAQVAEMVEFYRENGMNFQHPTIMRQAKKS